MERMLEKMAKQLCAYDQMSLSQLWPRYEARVRSFEPSREWEEAVVALCLIQAIRWKNQLFNYHLAATASPHKGDAPPVFIPTLHQNGTSEETAEDGLPAQPPRKATVLRFPGKTHE